MIGKRTLNKFIFIATPERIREVRPTIQYAIGEEGHITSAQDNMLEVLPPNSSKGDGVRRLLDAMSIPASTVMAIGDAENVGILSARIFAELDFGFNEILQTDWCY